MAFDTHASVKTLVAAGMPEAQAEAVTALIGEARGVEFGTLATKADLAETRADLRREIAEVRAELRQEITEVRADIAQTRAELRQEIAEVRADFAQTRAELRQDIAEAKADILKWVIGMVAGAVVVNAITVIGAMLALVRIVGH
jgi:multidrug resistance efflux pump